MEIGLWLPQLGGHVDRTGLRAFCERAEEFGYGSLWVQEHIFYPLNPVSGYSARPGLKVPDAYRSTLGALETLAAAAAWTSRPVVGTRILVAGLHRPVALAQQLSTIDVLSQGRLVAGFSVGRADAEPPGVGGRPRTRWGRRAASAAAGRGREPRGARGRGVLRGRRAVRGSGRRGGVHLHQLRPGAGHAAALGAGAADARPAARRSQITLPAPGQPGPA